MKECTKTERKSLAIFVENLYGGGVQKVLQTLLSHLDRERFTLTLWSVRKETLQRGVYPQDIDYAYLFETVHEGDSPLKRIARKTKNKIRLLVYYHFSPAVFYRLFVRKRYDIAIAFMEGYPTRLVSGAPAGTRRLAWVHTDLENNPWTACAFRSPEEEKACYRRFDKVVCLSRRIEEVMVSSFRMKGKTVRLWNPIDRGQILDASRKGLPEAFRKTGRLRLVSLGSLWPVKGYGRLLRCFRRLKDEGLDGELFLAGEGEERGKLSAYIRENGLEGDVFLTGFLENPFPLLASADIYVCSSLAEGLNTAVTEALVLGRPILSTACSGTEELLGDSRYGLVVSNDEEGLTDGLRRLLTDKELRRHYAEAALAGGSRFSIEGPLEAFYRLLR